MKKLIMIRLLLQKKSVLLMLFLAKVAWSFPQPMCKQVSDNLTFGVNSDNTSRVQSSSLDSIADTFSHNMRPTAFQCCLNPQGSIQGLKIRFESVQNDETVSGIAFFVDDLPKRIQTSCIGPNCRTRCQDFVNVDAFPKKPQPITGMTFLKDFISNELIDIHVITDQTSTSICGSQISPDSSTIDSVQVQVNAPIVGFEYTEDQTTLRSLTLVSNSCSMHSLSAFELELENVPEPIMLQIDDLNSSDFEMSIKLPLRPETLAHAEYGIEIDSVKCSYELEGSLLTPDVPSYISLRQEDAATSYYLDLKKHSQEGWPTEPRHDLIILQCNMGNGVFAAKRTLEVIFYDFDASMAQQSEQPCFHIANGYKTGQAPTKLDAQTMIQDYRYSRSQISLECCLNSQDRISSLAISKDNLLTNFKQDSSCIKSSIRLSDYSAYIIATDFVGNLVDLLLKPESQQQTDVPLFSVCNKDQSKITNFSYELIKAEDHGQLVTFDYLQSWGDSISDLTLVTNRCLITPEFASYPQPQLHSFIPGSEVFSFAVEDPSFPQSPLGQIREDWLPSLATSELSSILMGWQSPKSLTQEPFLHAKNIALQTPSNASILSRDGHFGIEIDAYRQNVAFSVEPGLSFQVYKKFVYESDVVKFEVNRLVAVIYMRDIVLPDDQGNDDDGEESDGDEQEPDDNDDTDPTDGETNDPDTDDGSNEKIEPKTQCELQVIYATQFTNYYIEDDDSMVDLYMHPVICNPATFTFHLEHSIVMQMGNLKGIEDQLIYSASDDHFVFETYDLQFVNKTAILTQVTNMYVLDESSGLETLKQTFMRQIATIKIKSRCNELQISPQQLKTMHVSLGSEIDVNQMFTPLKDPLDLIQSGKCGPVMKSISQDSSQQSLPTSVVFLDGYTICLSPLEAQGFKGSYDLHLNFDLVDFGYQYSSSFKVIIGSDLIDTKEEIRAAINIVPGFDKFEPGQRARLPPVSLMVNTPFIYLLPPIVEWNEDDKVTVSIRIGDERLAACNCIRLRGKDAILFGVPERYSGIQTAIHVFLSDGLEESFYYLSVNLKPFQEDVVEPFRPKTQTEIKDALANQKMLDQSVKGEDIDTDAERESHKKDLTTKVMEKCIPIYTRVSRNGEVRVRFARRLKITKDVDTLMQQIVDSGSIQVQMVDEGSPASDANPNKNFTWTLSMPDPKELLVKIEFEDPNAISSTSNDLDKLRITFVDTSKFLQCENAEDIKLEENQRQLQSSKQTKEKDSIPSGYVIIVEVPPQMSDEQIVAQEKTIEDIEHPTKTFYYSSLALATLNNLSLQTVWGSVNALQIIAHLPLNNINFPANSFHFFAFLAEVVSFDLFAPTDHADFGFTETAPLNHRFDDLGYETTNFFENLGSIGLIAVVMVLRMVFVPFLLVILEGMQCCKACKTCQSKMRLKCTDTTNFWLRFGLHTFLELIICSLVGLRLEQVIYRDPTWADSVAINATYAFSALTGVFMIFVGYMTMIKVRSYVGYQKEREEFSRAKQQQEVYQNPKFQTLLDYGPNVFFKKRRSDDPPFRTLSTKYDPSVKIVGGHTNLAIPLPKRRDQVVLQRPADCKRPIKWNFSYHVYCQELYRDLKPWKISAMPFFFWMLARRITFVFVAIYLQHQPFLQVLSYLVTSLLMACYLASYRVFTDSFTCRMELFNEVIVLMVGYHMVILMSTSQLDSEKRAKIGDSLIAFIVTLCVLCSLKFCYDQCKHSIFICKKTKANMVRKKIRRKQKKREKQLNQQPKVQVALTKNSLSYDTQSALCPSVQNQPIKDHDLAFTAPDEESSSVFSSEQLSHDGKLIIVPKPRDNDKPIHQRVNSEMIAFMQTEDNNQYEIETERQDTSQADVLEIQEEIRPGLMLGLKNANNLDSEHFESEEIISTAKQSLCIEEENPEGLSCEVANIDDIDVQFHPVVVQQTASFDAKTLLQVGYQQDISHIDKSSNHERITHHQKSSSAISQLQEIQDEMSMSRGDSSFQKQASAVLCSGHFRTSNYDVRVSLQNCDQSTPPISSQDPHQQTTLQSEGSVPMVNKSSFMSAMTSGQNQIPAQTYLQTRMLENDVRQTGMTQHATTTAQSCSNQDNTAQAKYPTPAWAMESDQCIKEPDSKKSANTTGRNQHMYAKGKGENNDENGSPMQNHRRNNTDLFARTETQQYQRQMTQMTKDSSSRFPTTLQGTILTVRESLFQLTNHFSSSLKEATNEESKRTSQSSGSQKEDQNLRDNHDGQPEIDILYEEQEPSALVSNTCSMDNAKVHEDMANDCNLRVLGRNMTLPVSRRQSMQSLQSQVAIQSIQMMGLSDKKGDFGQDATNLPEGALKSNRTFFDHPESLSQIGYDQYLRQHESQVMVKKSPEKTPGKKTPGKRKRDKEN